MRVAKAATFHISGLRDKSGSLAQRAGLPLRACFFVLNLARDGLRLHSRLEALT